MSEIYSGLVPAQPTKNDLQETFFSFVIYRDHNYDREKNIIKDNEGPITEFQEFVSAETLKGQESKQ